MHQLFPYAGSVWANPRTLERQVWDARTARAIPGVARALSLYQLIATCPMDATRNGSKLTRPTILERPDPDRGRVWTVAQHVEDYLLHGNACALVTAWDARTGWPASVRWYPATSWGLTEELDEAGQPTYWLNGQRVDRTNVVHVARGADPLFPWRGVGVVEQHLRDLERIGLQGASETENLRGRGMPNVAIITPLTEPDPEQMDAAADRWVERFRGPDPKPGFFPKDTQIVPLSWNPEQGQAAQARNLGLKDLANAFNLDSYWLGAEGSSHTYRSPGTQFLSLLKTSLSPVMAAFEEEWSWRFLPRGQGLRFDRTELLRDDLLSMVQAYAQGSALFPGDDGANEFRGLMGLPPVDFPEPPAPPAPPAPPVDDPAPATEDDPTDPEEDA